MLAHDTEAERILAACGANLPRLRTELDKFLQQNIEQFPRGAQKEPEQTLAFRRALQTAVLHVQSAGKSEVQAGDLLAALLQQNRSYAAQLLEGQGVTRLDVLELHQPRHLEGARAGRSGVGRTAGHLRPGRRRLVDVTDAARCLRRQPDAEGPQRHARPAGRPRTEVQRTMEILCRRRKNNPMFVGEPGVGKTALAEGLAQRLLQDDVPSVLKDARASRSTPRRCSPARGSVVTSRNVSRPWSNALSKRPKPILFIDEMHSTVGAGATTGGTMDRHVIKPVLSAGDIRVIGATTFEEFKQVEKDAPSPAGCRRWSSRSPRSRRRSRSSKASAAGTRTTTTSRIRAAIETAAKLAGRHLRDYRLPDSAIECSTRPVRCCGCRRHRCRPLSGTDRKRRRRPAGTAGRDRLPGCCQGHGGGQARRFSHGGPGCGGGPRQTVDVAEIEGVIARMARIPDKQAHASDKDGCAGSRSS